MVVRYADLPGLLESQDFDTLGALGSIVTFLGTVSIIPFLPNAWAVEAGGFPAMYLPVAFLSKDFLFLAASFYLLKQDFARVTMNIEPQHASADLKQTGGY